MALRGRLRRAPSNANTHLRAGLGRPQRVLVPDPPEWRWMASRRALAVVSRDASVGGSQPDGHREHGVAR